MAPLVRCNSRMICPSLVFEEIAVWAAEAGFERDAMSGLPFLVGTCRSGALIPKSPGFHPAGAAPFRADTWMLPLRRKSNGSSAILNLVWLALLLAHHDVWPSTSYRLNSRRATSVAGMRCGWSAISYRLNSNCGQPAALISCGWSAISYRLNYAAAHPSDMAGCGWSAISYRLNFFTGITLALTSCGWSAISYRLNCRLAPWPHSLRCGWSAISYRLNSQ